MKKSISIALLVAILLFGISALAVDKVVVIPLVKQAPTTCTEPNEVIAAGGRCWKDRNLGAARVATSLIDGLAFGDYFQWGRLSDGHQYPSSTNIAANSSEDVPRHSYFITESTTTELDWRTPQNDNLWQGLHGINNPCPQGFRVPTAAEWETEIASWSSHDALGAFASPLKLVLSGMRSHTDGTIISKTVSGSYWSSTVAGNQSRQLAVGSSYTNTYNSNRARGMSIRCIKD